MAKRKSKRELPRWQILLIIGLHSLIAYILIFVIGDSLLPNYRDWGSNVGLYLAAGQFITFGYQYLYWQLQRFLLRHPGQPKHIVFGLRAILFVGLAHGMLNMSISAILAGNVGVQAVIGLIMLLNLATTVIIHRQPRAIKHKRLFEDTKSANHHLRLSEKVAGRACDTFEGNIDDGEIVNARHHS